MTIASTEPDLPLRGASPLVAYRRFWQRSVTFTGRASLSEFWWPVLLNAVVAIAIGVVAAVLLTLGATLREQGTAAAAVPTSLGAVLLLVLLLFVIAQILPGIASSIRRLHDADLSGWFYLLSLIPSVGGLILIVLNVLPANEAGRRFDRGAAGWTPPAAWTPPAPRPVERSAAVPFDTWPAPSADPPPAAPSTAQLPAQEAAPEPGAVDAVRAAWQRVGAVHDVSARLSAQPSWRSQGYLLIDRADGIGVLSTLGLAAAEGVAALGPGAEVYLASTALAGTADRAADGWELGVVASVARRVQVSGMHLPAELQQYGALSMTVPAPSAPEAWRTADGAVGVLIGLPLPGVPEAVVTRAGEVRLIGLVPLRPEELRRILDGGRVARADIAERLAALPPAALTAPDRPAV